MLTEIADGVWVRQSDWMWSNSTVVRIDEGLLVVDPGIHGAELAHLADELDALDVPVIAGFSTHPHWDHLLWHARFGDVPRYATAANVAAATAGRQRGQQMAAESAQDVPMEPLGLVTAMPAAGLAHIQLIETEGHAQGHASLWLADRGVLIAGDMLSDVFVPMPDPRGADRLATYLSALDRLADAAIQAQIVVPGHGSIARGDEISARLATDRAYLEALVRGETPADERWGPRG